MLPHADSYIRRLLKALRKCDVRIVTGARLTDLVFENGRVVGASARSGADPAMPVTEGEGAKLQIRARKGVILATGDFSGSRALKDRFVGLPRAKAAAINPLATGDGHLAATRLGAKVLNGDVVWGPELRFAKPPSANWATRLPDWPWFVKLARFAFQHLPSGLSKRIRAQYLQPMHLS